MMWQGKEPLMYVENASGNEVELHSMFPVTFNYIAIAEGRDGGGQVLEHVIEYQAFSSGIWHAVGHGTTIGLDKKSYMFESVTTNRTRVRVLASTGEPTFSFFGAYLID